MSDHIPNVTKMINQWTNGTEILNVKPNGDFELGNGVDPLVALGQLAKAFMQQQDRIKRLEEALEGTVKWIVHLADSGDAGFWNPEEQLVIIAARAALKKEAKP